MDKISHYRKIGDLMVVENMIGVVSEIVRNSGNIFEGSSLA
jgi:hypothetical protein